MSKQIDEQLLDVGAGTAVSGGQTQISRKTTSPPDGKRYIGQSGEDFPTIDDEEYITHRAVEWLEVLEEKAKKKDEVEDPEDILPDEVANPQPPPSYEPEPADEDPAAEDPNAAADPNADPNAAATDPAADPNADPNAMGGMDPNDPNAMGGMGGMDPNMGMGGFTSSEIGRIYELKKIYSRLMTIEAFLGEETNEDMIKLRSYVSKAIDLFETLIANIQAYKDQLDEIIVNYYKFVQQVFSEIRTYYKAKSLKDKEVK
jgi:hypothetical protein